jgi:hypothetical protein
MSILIREDSARRGVRVRGLIRHMTRRGPVARYIRYIW